VAIETLGMPQAYRRRTTRYRHRLAIVGAFEDWERLDSPWRAAFGLAWDAFADGTVPVGAVVVDENGTIVAEGRNRIFADSAPPKQIAGTRLAHAEVNALAQLPTDRRWSACTLYTTLEPCVLCVGAASVATVGRIRFAGSDVYSGSSALVGRDVGARRPLGLTIEGPLDGPFELLGAALHLAFFSSDGAGSGALVDTYSSLRPDIPALASTLLRLRHGTLEQALTALDREARAGRGG
jgi:tRNA(adenine34) deaminase